MRGEAATMTNDLQVADFHGINPMLNAFEARFIPAAEGSLMRAEFRTTKQKPGESLLKFHTRMRTLFVRAYPNEAIPINRHLIDTFVAGIADPAIKMYVLDRTPDTYAEALTHAQTKEANLLTYQASQGGAVNAVTDGVNAMQGEEKKCYICGSTSHFFRECPMLQKMQNLVVSASRGRGTSGNRRGQRGGRWNRRGQGRGRGHQNTGRGVNQLQEEEDKGAAAQEQGEDEGFELYVSEN